MWSFYDCLKDRLFSIDICLIITYIAGKLMLNFNKLIKTVGHRTRFFAR